MSRDNIEETKKGAEMYDLLDCLGVRYTGRYACCPFHDDRRPSAVINEDTMFCYVCNRPFDKLHIVMEITGYNFTQAMDFLKNMKSVSGIPEIHKRSKPREVPVEKGVARSPLTEEGRANLNTFFGMLVFSERGRSFLEGRGITPTLAEKYKIRTLEDPAGLLNHLKNKISKEQLLQCGLANESEYGDLYPTLFREGIVLPFLDQEGAPEYVTVRSYIEEPKYLKLKGVAQPVFKGPDFYKAETVFCFEGIFDGLAYESLTGQSNFFSFSGLPGVSQILQFQKENAGKTAVLALDNDESGRKRTEELCQKVNGLSVLNWDTLLKDNGVPEDMPIKDMNDLLIYTMRR